MTAEQNLQLVREYVKNNFVSAGMCADLCIHDKEDGNPHAHIMLTMRPLEKDGKWGQKSRTENGVKIPTVDWNNKDKAEQWRGAWAQAVNDFLKQENRAERIDHRSFERQGKEEVPTVHLGVAACQMERKGIKTDKGNKNRAAEVTNSELKQLRVRIRKAKDWLYAQPIENAPTMISVMSVISSGKNLNTQWQKVADLKARAHILLFLQSNHIKDIGQLADKVEKINDEYYEVSKEIKKADRRLETLNKHIKQADIYFEYKAIYQQYNEIKKPKKQAEFREKHAKEITLFENAKEYIDGVMNGKRPFRARRGERSGKS